MKEKSNLPIPELLAPAGSPAALEAAIEAGSDAVYFGGTEFSNRMRAKNFDSQGIIDAIRLCRKYSVASHITLNIRLRDRELPRVLGYAAELYEAGADAFIVADLGLAALIKRELPDISLHASTQLTGSSPLDAETLAAFGFDRMVCPRELSCEELFRLVRSSPISIEAFVHGAHCVSVSGQCLMSWAIGGRSGNRGECAQPCRLPFTCLHGCSHGSAWLREKTAQINADTRASCGSSETAHPRSCPAKRLSYPLSLKDMCLAAHIPELINTGVSSLKIEGRLKSPDYVYGVTRIYRRLLDERRAATSEELRELESIFSRGGFTDGYFTNRYSSMCGIRSKNALPSPVKFTALSRKIPLAVSVKVKSGEPVTLTASEKVAKFNRFAPRTVSVSGVSPERARTAPLTEESLYRSLSKLGSTPYILFR